MVYKNITMMVFGATALGLSAAGSAAMVTDTLDANNPGLGTTFWTPTIAQQTSAPYYRWNGEDWQWQHAAIAGPFTTASLAIGAFDVDEPDEQDDIYGWDLDAGAWSYIGTLSGADDAFDTSVFSLASSWFDEIAAGLQIKLVIDALDDGWAVSLSKSSLSIDGGVIPNPDPSAVPIPAAAFLFAPALLGFMGLRRKAKNTVA